ncbi:MAG: winged helix DNA-binding protein [Chloroflexi bacterium]|nr:winged helix DNA-binding protein [Chloroflexota bacterium]
MADTASANKSKASRLFSDRDFNLWVLLQNTRDTLVAARAKELRQLGISNIEAAVLFTVQAIEENGQTHATPTEISRWLFRKQNSISALLRRMEKKGLVGRVSDLPRKNLVRIVLTREGRRIYEQSTKRPCVRRILSALSDAQGDQLSSLLLMIRDKGLKELGMPHKRPFPY